ncbi:2-octaprenyl-6-methoxyphenyl hydroxylase [Alkalilimnicola sp. S0819]|uniref:2-octaprenyl-6-methoxyphenyl hydroxylase n=1 Tax=Alkalilimnicola sp. S0819 TaxID=2613922 RepID=UPI0012614614|nr:2-octaprenyl-6-methoxyphenyl hydroxylase [Alkalilimnicola sp. S0819]KAB7628210.1 2-octaprenyl-6-methoxyphenyl hydroxylase [Alkalilimnicola sp. S0819]MPQ15101.1 2-octaprenyl-6-methoxyphenyl hydroxylase [Alkalilimnicola sp. S0819]
MASFDYDVLIVGGGLVGSALACALADTPARVGVIEAVPPGEPGQPSYDERSTAIAASTQRILQALSLWPALRAEAAPIRCIHVSERGRFGVTRMNAEEEGLEALGWVVSNRALGAVLPARAAAADNVDYLCPASLEGLRQEASGVSVTITEAGGERSLRGRLLVLADGVRSRGRGLLGVAVREDAYGQAAVIANITPERDHAGVAYERFGPDGPLALLPLTGGRCALIWTVPSARRETVLAMDDEAFLAEVQQRFGFRLGRLLRAGERAAYPLARVRAEHLTVERAVLLGNAAHSLHPVAGQGFNLSLRDAACLAELVHEALGRGEDPGRAALLHRYEDLRRADYRTVDGFTHGLVRGFGLGLPGLGALRGLGLGGMDLLPGVKRDFVRHATGRAGTLPRLAVGLPLGKG